MDKTTILVVALFPVAFAAIWSGVTLLLAFVSGWTSLAKVYRGRLTTVASSVSMSSGGISRFGFPVSYRNVLNVAIGAEGVELSVFPLFGLGSPRLMIPWSHIGPCDSYRWLGMMDRFSFRPIGCDVKITLAGGSARMLTAEVAGGTLRRALASA
jgi:hypothetical protein